jgi:RimJ/RimL family protein N-acetyltransferase
MPHDPSGTGDTEHQLTDGRMLLIRPATVGDAAALLEYVEAVGGESDFLSFGAGDFGLSLAEEEVFLRKLATRDNEFYIVGQLNGAIVSALTFTAGERPRVRHRGEFGISVRKEFWGMGIGSLMLDRLLEWARRTQIINKINLRVRADNLRAIRLYERKGFVREGTITREVLVDGNYFSHYLMGLQL